MAAIVLMEAGKNLMVVRADDINDPMIREMSAIYCCCLLGAEKPQRFRGGESQQVIGSHVKGVAELFKNRERWRGYFANHIAEIPHADVASFSGGFIRKVPCLADLQKGSGEIV